MRNDNNQIDTLTGIWLILIAAVLLTAAGIYRYQRQAAISKQNAARMVQQMQDQSDTEKR